MNDKHKTLLQFITCDAEHCGHKHPTKWCSKCKMAFYCSRDCQTAGWNKVHKKVCPVFAAMTAQAAAAANETRRPTKHVTGMTEGSAETAGSCGICLEETITDPIVFDKCKHAFCYACVVQYQTSDLCSNKKVGSKTKCPYCRTEIPDVVESTDAKIDFLVAQVEQGGMPAEERNSLVTKTLANLQKLCDAGDPILKIMFTNGRAKLLSLRGDHLAALNELNEALPEWTEKVENGKKLLNLAAICRARNLDFSEQARKYKLDRTSANLHVTDLIGLYLHIARMHMKLENWEGAGDVYELLCQRFPVPHGMTFDQQGKMFRGALECHYQMKKYDMCIWLGEVIMEKYPFAPSAVKATALAYKAIGNMDKARELAAKGVLYSVACNETKEMTWDFWKEINEEGAVSASIFGL